MPNKFLFYFSVLLSCLVLLFGVPALNQLVQAKQSEKVLVVVCQEIVTIEKLETGYKFVGANCNIKYPDQEIQFSQPYQEDSNPNSSNYPPPEIIDPTVPNPYPPIPTVTSVWSEK